MCKLFKFQNMHRSLKIYVRILVIFIFLKGHVYSVPYIKETNDLIDNAYLVDTPFRMLSSYFQPNATNPTARGYTDLFEPARIAEPVCPNKYIKFYLYNSLTSHYTLKNRNYYRMVSCSPSLAGKIIATAFFCRKYPTTPVELKMDCSIENVYFIEGAKIQMLFHAYVGDVNDTPNLQCRQPYVERNYNVVSVSYPALVRFFLYQDAIKNVQTIANCSALMIEYIVENRKDIELEQFHVIGFSVGGQIVGQIFRYMTMGQLSHVTALDATFPGFDNFTRYSITSQCAKFTDTYMSNAGISGVPCPWADVNFVINGGVQQPTCPPGEAICNHEVAAVVYCLSVNLKYKFVGKPCDGPITCASPEFRGKNSSQLAGAYVSPEARGTYCFDAKNIKSYTTAEIAARKLAGGM